MRKNTVIFIVLVFACSFLAGCQPTPEEPIVVNKNDGALENAIEAAPAPEIDVVPVEKNEDTDKIDTFEKWNETYEFSSLVCTFDAEMRAGKTQNLPVVKIKKTSISEEMSNKLVEYFAKGAVGVCPTSDTQEDLLEKLFFVKKGNYVFDDNGGRWEPYEGQAEEIKQIEEQIKSTPKQVFSPISTKLVEYPIDLTYQLEDGTKKFVQADGNSFVFKDIKFCIIQPESWVAGGESIPGEPAGTTLDNIIVSFDEASELVQSLIDEVGLSDTAIADHTKARIINSNTGNVVSEGWLFYLSRTYGDYVPVDFSEVALGGIMRLMSEEYVPRWFSESVKVYVDEQGIRYCEWNNPNKIIETVNENVAILGVDEIKKHIKDTFKFGLSWVLDDQSEEQIKITVSDVLLTGVMVPIRNDLDHQYILPAWLVYYQVEGQEGTSVFAVNAIDGSSIDLSMRRKIED